MGEASLSVSQATRTRSCLGKMNADILESESSTIARAAGELSHVQFHLQSLERSFSYRSRASQTIKGVARCAMSSGTECDLGLTPVRNPAT